MKKIRAVLAFQSLIDFMFPVNKQLHEWSSLDIEMKKKQENW
jgi:hypothetical protein